MPLGLKNASKTFQRMVEYVLRNFIGKSVIVFIDDILVYSKTREEHEEILKEVLNTLQQNELYLKSKKCEFFRKKVTFLGHVISNNKVEMDPAKIQIVREWGELETKKDVQRFLGFANFYRRFIKGFAKIADPLNKLITNTPDKARIEMKAEERKAQRELIEAITSEPALTVFDSAKKTKVVTDASNGGLGAILMQWNEELKHWQTIEFQSRALDGDRTKRTGEYKLAPRNLELCAISYALEKFRPYLAGHQFTVTSDHRSLELLEESKINNGRLARILEQMAEYDFKIEYSEGTSAIITVADALSRLPKYRRVLEEESTEQNGEKENTGEEDKIMELFEILGFEDEKADQVTDFSGETKNGEERKWGTTEIVVDEVLLTEIRKGYRDDEEQQEIIDTLKKEKEELDYRIPKEKKFQMSNYRWDEEQGLLYRSIADTERLCIPKTGTLRLNRILEAHDTPLGGHFGREKTLASVARNFFWSGMTRDVEDFVKSCDNCQRNKTVRRAPIGLLFPHSRSQQRWEKIALDFITHLPRTRVGGFDAILTVVDFFSRRTHFIPCHSTVTAVETAQLLREYVIKHHGYPKYIVSDRGSIFTSGVWKELFRCLQAKQNLSSSYHPQTDGITEKENDIIENCIRAFTNYQQDDWNEYIADFELAINASKNDTTGMSPQFIDTGYEPFIPLGITREIEEMPTDKTAKDLVERLDAIKLGVQLMFAKAQEKQAQYANGKRRDIEFQEGEFVMVNSDFVYDPIHTDRPLRKLVNKWLGPFRVEKKISRVSYRIFIPKEDKIKIHPVIHIANLKKYVENPERFIERNDYTVPEPLKDSENETVFMVDEILDVKLERKKRLFLIKWTGYDDPTWEKEEILRASPDFVQHIEQFLEELRSGSRRKMARNVNRRNSKAKIK